MKVILVFVSSLNGKITRGDDPEVRIWSSESDKKHYHRIWENSSLIVMGRNTFTQNIIKPSGKRLVVVMTSKPELYADRSVPDQIEFTSETPCELVERFSQKGEEGMTVVGGSMIASAFLKESLVDEIVLTIEPVIFGRGIDIFHEEDFESLLRLKEVIKANENGTLITVYEVKKQKRS